MGATSLTTCVAFIATAISPIMPIASFGIYAAMGVLFNYVLVMTLFPCTLMIWHYKLYGCCDKACGRSFCCCHQPFTPPKRGEQATWCPPCTAAADGAAAEPTLVPSKQEVIIAKADGGGGGEEQEEVLDSMSRFFKETYAPCINNRAVSGGMVALGVAYIIFSITQALQLEPPTEQEKWFPEDHMFQQLVDSMETFNTDAEDSYVEVRLAFGLTGMDRDGINFWEPCCLENGKRGSVQYDSSFDLSSAAAQSFFSQTCAALMAQTCTAGGCSGNRLVKPEESTSLWCWINDFQAWCAASSGANLVAGTSSCVGADFLPNLLTFRASVNGQLDAQIGIIEGKLKYAFITVRSTLLQFQPNAKTEPVFDEFNKFRANRLAVAPPGMQSMVHSGGIFWTWTFTEAQLVTNVFVGFAICFPCAFVILMLATRNIVVSLVAITSVVGIVASVMGFCKWAMGWGLGIAESIASVIVIGFSVDYVVHLAHMYVDAGHRTPPLNTREERVTFALKSMGVTVMSGAITTFGSGFFLVATQLIFFVKFSILIMVTIASSIIIAICFFMPSLALLGPENTTGDLQVMCGCRGNNEEADKAQPKQEAPETLRP